MHDLLKCIILVSNYPILHNIDIDMVCHTHIPIPFFSLLFSMFLFFPLFFYFLHTKRKEEEKGEKKEK